MVDKSWARYIKPKRKDITISMPLKIPIIMNHKRAQEMFYEVRKEYLDTKAVITKKKESFEKLRQTEWNKNTELMHIKREFVMGSCTEKDVKVATGFLIAIYAKTEFTAEELSKLYRILSKNKYADTLERRSAQMLAEDYHNCALSYRKEQELRSRRN